MVHFLGIRILILMPLIFSLLAFGKVLGHEIRSNSTTTTVQPSTTTTTATTESSDRFPRHAVPVAPVAATNETGFSACRTKECLEIDENMVRKVDQTLNPCDDFYQFACGKLNSNSEAGGSVNEVVASRNTITSRLRDILEERNSSKDWEPLKLSKDMHKACMNYAETPSELKHMISSVGGWSLERNWSAENFSLDGFYEKSVDLGYIPSSLFTIDIVQHPDETDKKIIAIMKPLTETFSGWPVQIKTYLEMNHFASPSLLNDTASNIETPQAALLQSYESNRDKEKEVADAYKAPSEPKILKLSQMMNKSDGIPWIRILQGVFKPMNITPEREILVECEQCLENLAKTFVTKDKKSLADYLIWNLIADNLVDINYETVMTNISTPVQKPSKENFCTLRVASLFRKVMNYEYSNRYLDASSESVLKKFIDQLKASFESILRGSKYLDPETRQKALKKLSAMKFYTPYDREINDKDEIARYYVGLEINSESFVQSLAKVRKHIIKQTVNSLDDRKPLEVYHRRIWKNSRYDPFLNSVFLSAGSLENLMFTKNRPNYLNFGALGSLIGHEIAHGFSLEGRFYDESGKQRNWWKKKSWKEQNRRVRCFADEYRKYANETSVDNTKAEIIADNDGARIAYKSYVNTPELAEKDEKLPSFGNWSSRQMFWISYANVLCAEVPKSNASRHALPPARINGVVSNSQEFARDFRCGAGTKMNSPKKCNLWL